MTVCTNDVALGHLVEDALPRAVSKPLSDAEFLVSEPIELEHDRVALAAVDARVLTQVSHQILDAFSDQGLLAAFG
jgi:hypothetical protein